MTRFLALMCVLLMALSTAVACGTSPPPSLPPDSPSDVFTRLTSDSADDFLNEVTTYAWEDDGAAVGARFTWIGRDAASTDRDAASQAEQSAAIVANFLLTHHNNLMSVGSGFLGLTKVPAAQLNPLLIRSYASAVAPYVDQFVSGDDEAFGSLRSKVAEDPATLRNLLAILVADPDAGRTMAQAADTAAAGFEDDAAAAPPDSDASVADLTAAGSLLGSVEGAVTHVGAADVSTPTIGEALNDLSVRIATALVRSDPNPATLSRYVRNGQLMAPADVEREFTQDDMRNYLVSLRSYLSEKGFGAGLDAFQDAFRAGSGEDSP